MKILKIKPLLILFSFLMAFGLYWPSIQGTPIWDDLHYWFSDPVMTSVSYGDIVKNFAWPFSVSSQKILYSIFGTNYLVYHLINFSLHCLNSLLVYKLGRQIRVRYPIIFFMLFLFHPVSVITTSWMIQFKTLLCFFFALTSCLTFIKGNKNWRWMAFSWILFLFSITSKSASLSLPIIFLIANWKNYGMKKLHLLIPFFLISSWGVHKVLVSPITQEASEKAAQITQIKDATPSPKVEIPDSVPSTPDETKQDIPSSSTFSKIDWGLISQTLRYYFWQAFVPINNIPVKGLNYEKANLADIGHIVFLLLIALLCWRDSALLYLAAAHFLLLPFLGIIPAPFMTITWVSDQHLYLVLPALLAFWMRVLTKLKWKHTIILPALMVLFFIYKTSQTTPLYKNQITFYEASLNYNPRNVPIAYNLAIAYILKGKWQKAHDLIDDVYQRGKEDHTIKSNSVYPQLIMLYLDMQDTEGENEN